MAEDERGGLRPTIVTPPVRGAKATPRSRPAPPPPTPVPVPVPVPAPTVMQPTMIAGTPRERIPVTARDLRALSPGADRAVVERALALLDAVVADKVSERKAILWGHALQKAYGDAVAETLALSQSPVIRRVQDYIGRMLEILGAFDPMAAAEDDRGLGRVLRRLNRRIDTVEELAAARGELDRIVRLMGGALDELLDLKDRLGRNAATLDMIALDVEATALAALFLAQHLRPAAPALADRFVERSMSLTQTVAQIRGNDTIRDIQLEQPIRMIGAIQNVMLVTMPDFLASLAAIGTLAARNVALSPTDATELTYKLQSIIAQLRM